MRSEKGVLDAAQSIAPAAIKATTNGTGVDLLGYDSALVVVNAGAWTDGTHTFKLQESDDNSTFSDVDSDDLDGSAPAVSSAATDGTVYRFAYLGSKRYIRVVSTVTGSPSTGAVYGAAIVRGRPKYAPLS